MKFSKDEIRKSMQLYAVTDRMWLKAGETLPEVVEQVLKNGATFLQLREKELDPVAIEKEAEQLKELCAHYHVPFVVNDSVEIALACHADGVHVGQSDIKGRDIRALIGPDRILGMTARTVEQAKAAEAAGADYIGVGAVFRTGTKKDAKKLERKVLEEICRSVTIPVVAIGGISRDNVTELKGSGVAGAAVVSAIFAAQDPGKAAKELYIKTRELF
ncbi:MAG: thiamine phosphate synthase [Clostridiaceae bacterium]|nr:thiamine phosphate synthase [Clostridiaceae bacterium]